MPDWVTWIILLGMIVGFGYVAWKMYQKEEFRKREKEQMKHELNMKKIENGQKTTADNLIEIVPESLKYIGNIITPWWKKKK